MSIKISDDNLINISGTCYLKKGNFMIRISDKVGHIIMD